MKLLVASSNPNRLRSIGTTCLVDQRVSANRRLGICRHDRNIRAQRDCRRARCSSGDRIRLDIVLVSGRHGQTLQGLRLAHGVALLRERLEGVSTGHIIALGIFGRQSSLGHPAFAGYGAAIRHEIVAGSGV